MIAIKRFKNGKIKMEIKIDKRFSKPAEKEFSNIEDIKQSISMDDLHFNRINGYNYLIDLINQKVFEGEDISKLLENKAIYFYPLSRKLSKSLLQDLSNGY